MPPNRSGGGAARGPALPPILPAPKPAPKAKPTRAPALPRTRTSTTTGSNPRGVAISRPVPMTPKPPATVNDRAARTLATGNNPRGVAISRPAQKPTTGDHYEAVRDTFVHQSAAGQAKILKGVQAGRADPVTSRAVRDAVKGLSKSQQHAIGMAVIDQSGTGLQGLSDLLGKGLNLLEGLHQSATKGPEGSFSGVSQAGLSAGKLGDIAVRAPVDVARATLESPGVIPKTAKGLGELALGGTAALAELPIKGVENTLQGHPGKTFTDLYHGMVRDYNARYGPLAAGNDRAFINRIKKQGAGPEAVDALGLVGGADATLGRAITGAAKTSDALRGARAAEAAASGGARFTAGESGPATDAFAPTNFLTRPRPGLRVGGGEVRPQTLAGTAGRATFQRAEDALRAAKEHVHPGEIKPAEGEVRPLFGNRSQRILASHVAAKWRNVMARQINNEVRHGATRTIARLSKWEQRAFPVAVEGGIPLRSGERAAKDAIDLRMRQIEAYRKAHPDSPGATIPPQLAKQIDELAHLQQLRDNIGKWLTPKLADAVDREGARNVRLEDKMPDQYLRKPTAEARRLRAQGDALGIEHPDEMAQRMWGPTGHKDIAEFARAHKGAVKAAETQAAKHMREYELARPGHLADYAKKVRAAAAEKRLPAEPGFFHHTDVPGEKFGDYTIGMGHRPIPTSKRSEFELHKSGAIWRDPRVYTTGLARSIKVGHQWSLVDEQFRRSNLFNPSADAIRAAGYGDKHPQELDARQYARAMQHEGHKLENMRLYNPGRLRESTLNDHGGLPMPKGSGNRSANVPSELEAEQLLHDLVGKHSVAADSIPRNSDDPFLKTPGWRALPPAAFNEIHSSLQPSGLTGRLVGKVQGTAAHLILGGSPSFLVMNTLAHMLLATFGTRGRILSDAVKFPMWWHGLSDDERAMVDAHAGGRINAQRADRLGSTTPGKIRDSWQQLKEKGVGRFTVGHVTTMANPFQLLFKAEDLQSHYFRRMVYYNATKRAALNSMTKDMALGTAAMNRLEHVFTLGPKEQMLGQIANLHTAEELGRYTVNMMGDYTRFTSAERKFLNNRAVLFYSFMRHATRTLFYVLPVKHPIATALVGEMANLHNDEVKKLLGGADLPYADSRVFFNEAGHLTSIDFNRSSPVGSFGVDLPTEGIGGLAQVIPPELQPVLNAIYGSTPTGGKYNPGVLSLLNSFASLSYPYRLLQDLHDGTQLQQSDSIPFIHDDPQTKKTAAAQAYQAAKEQALGPLKDKVLASLLGVYPKPDDIGVIAARQEQAANGGNTGWGSLSRGSSSSWGGWGGGGGTTGGWGGWGG